MGSKKWWVVWLISMILALVKFDSFVFAWGDDENTRSTLRGLQAVHLMISYTPPDTEKKKVFVENFQRDLVLKFRLAGIKESYEPGDPTFLLQVIFFKFSDFESYVYHIRAYFKQSVKLERVPHSRAVTITWLSDGVTGVDPSLDFIRERAKDEIDKFINAYLSVNPK